MMKYASGEEVFVMVHSCPTTKTQVMHLVFLWKTQRKWGLEKWNNDGIEEIKIIQCRTRREGEVAYAREG